MQDLANHSLRVRSKSISAHPLELQTGYRRSPKVAYKVSFLIMGLRLLPFKINAAYAQNTVGQFWER